MSAPRKRPRQQRSQFTFEAILDAAAQLFERDGYLNTTTNKIAELAGISIGTLYHYIPNKDALLHALATRHDHHNRDVLLARFAVLHEENPSLPDTMRQVITELASHHHDEPHLNRMLTLQAQRSSDFADHVRELETTLATEVERQLRRMNVGGSDPYLTSLLLVQGITAMMHGAVIEPPPDRRTDDVVELVVTMWTGALQATGAPKDSMPFDGPVVS
ncbi:TetR/AcrR family transcriptional regulator [Nocardia altamirensis]|uniref:TetR/AcrR family transcriptional regulator n=1 Tax=Nocardia altamirensis TaxID=472158 RepID=UPI0008405673|nr:TetR/AcrR family transcriptional regulator [Nocardia altamirensis]